ncbi:fMet-Leu-Phe receptor-like [Engystomops pustulosus]|uniref:fMet-Leu-Phe receptor-like n=1 Tax=Engystomops pustulosus TaxID=76066 RepID=UPI003AFB19B0
MDPTDDNLTLLDITLDYHNWSRNDGPKRNHTDTSQSNSHEMDVLNTLGIVFFTIIFALGIIGNGMVIWIAGFRMKKTISAVWFLNLAIADLLCCSSIPVLIADWACVGFCSSSLSSEIFCLFSIILFNLNMSASVLLLTAMSIDRWVSVMWPFWTKVHRTQKLLRNTAGIIWVMSLIWTGIMLYYFAFDYNFDIQKTKTIQLIRFVIMFVIPFLIIFTSYVTIVLKLKKSKRPQRSQRPYRIITAVILGFFFCWAPYQSLPIIHVDYVNLLQLRIVDIIMNWLVYLNSCINPIIYVFMGQDFRHSFVRSIPSRVERALSEHLDDPCRGGEAHEPFSTTGV